MSHLDTCPDPAELDRLLRGGGEDDAAQRLAEHLDRCEACRRRAESIGPDASLEHDLHWAARVRERTQLRVDEPLARLNEILPDYRILGEIGRGGMGIVYRAVQPKLNRHVAIKVLPALLGAVRPDAKARFRREAELAAGLDHTNIISVHDFGEVDGTLYYAMQLIRGRSLRQVLDEVCRVDAQGCVVGDPCTSRSAGPPTLPGRVPGAARAYYLRIARWIAEVADALQYAHDRGVIHRDIKPSNLLLTEDGKLMISDFGLARAVGACTITGSNALMGTCRYMAPESLEADAPGADHRADIYALGATLYELLAFRPMYAGADDRSVVHQIASREPTPPHRLVRTVPRELETICLKATQRNPDDRYPSAAAMGDDLRRWLLDLPIEARRASLAARGRRLLRRHRVPAAFALACVLLLVTSATLWAKYRTAMNAGHRSEVQRAVQESRGHTMHARTLMDEEHYAQALAALERALAADPNGADARHVHAEVLIRTGRTQQARTLLETLAARDPTDWNAHYLLGRLTNIEWARAHASLAPTGQPDPGGTRGRSAVVGGLLSYVERLRPGSPEALTLRSTLETADTRAIELLDRALAIDPYFTDALFERAHRLGCLGRHEEALAALDTALQAGHGGSQTHGARGITLYHLNRWGEAEQAFSAAIACDPHNIDWWYDRAIVRTYLGKVALAAEDATQALALNPGYAYALVARGRALSAMGRAGEALDDFDRAATLDPDHPDVYVERGLLHWRAGRYDRSLADANRLIELDPHATRGYQRRAQTFLRLGRWDEALADLDRCDQIDRLDFATPTIRGGVLFEAGRYADAALAFETAESRRPDSWGNYHYHTLSLLRDARPEGAIAPLTAWITLAENKDAARMLRGMVYESLGESTLALADYAAAAGSGRLGGYPHLWTGVLHTLAERHDLAREAFEHALLASMDDPWIRSVIAVLQGDMSPVSLEQHAHSDTQRAESQYYAGVASLATSQNQAAAEYLSRAVDAASAEAFESEFARLRLRMLQKHPD